MLLLTLPMLLLALAACLGPAFAAIVETFPFNGQLPPVARVGEAYEYQLSSQTFQSTTGAELTVALTDAPDWLQFDPATLKLTGNPENSTDTSEGDYSASFTFAVTDTDNSSASFTCSLIVTSAEPPTVDSAVADSAIADFAATDGSNGIVLKPGEPFTINFPLDTFTAPQNGYPISTYYGRSGDHTPLPAWLHFSAGDNLTFYGTAPAINSNIAPSQSFPVALIATEFAGFTGASVPFAVLVGAHQLTVNGTADLTAESGSSFEFDALSYVFLDGEPISRDNVSSVEIQSVSGNDTWLQLDSESGVLSGTPSESSDEKTVVEVKVVDRWGNAVDLSVQITTETNEGVFANTELSSVNATRGDKFSFTLPSSVTQAVSGKQLTVQYDPSDAGEWLKFDSDSATFSGTVPSEFDHVDVTVKVADSSDSSDNSNTSGVLRFRINGVPELSTTSSATPTSSATATPTTSASTVASASASATSSATAAPVASSGSSNRTVAIACGVAIPVGLLLIAALLFFCWRRRRAQRKDALDTNSSDGEVPPMEKEKFGNINGSPGGSGGPYPAISHPILNNPHNGPEARWGAAAGAAGAAGAAAAAWDSPHRLTSLSLFDGTAEQFGSDFESGSGSGGSPGGSANSASSSHSGNSESDFRYYENLSRSSDQLLSENGSRASHGSGPTAPAVAQVRSSWRRTLDSRTKWHERQSLNSLATVSTDELFSVRLVDSDDEDAEKVHKALQERRSHLGFRDSEFLGSTASVVLSGGGSSSGSNRKSRNRISRLSAPALADLTEEASPSLPADAPTDKSEPLRRSENFRSIYGVPGESQNSIVSAAESQDSTSFIYNNNSEEYRRKSSLISTVGARDNSVPVKLVDFTREGRIAEEGGEGSSGEQRLEISKSVSAELAFL